MDDARVISNYKLVRQIGIGGMGVVYLGQHTVIDRKVAIKLLRSEYSNNEELVRRFFNEARAAAASRHPGIVEILDVGFDERQAFITMEFIEGETLSKYVRSRTRLHPLEALSFCRQVACALGVAHAQNIVHRDLKPSNIMVAMDADTGLPMTKVFDFGIAKLFDENSSHTRTGVVIGTPLYMSPEQCKGAGEVDTRSDLYSLGCILYFMLTGKRVFSGKGDGEIIAQHIFIEPPSPKLLAPVSDELCEIVLRLLAKEPGARFQTAGELVVALDAIRADMEERLQLVPVPNPRPASVLPFAAPAQTGTGVSSAGISSALSPATSPGTGASVSATPAQVMYPSPNSIPEVVPPPTLMRRLARKGGWIAAGFALVVVIVVGAVSTGDSDSDDAKGLNPSAAGDPQDPAKESETGDSDSVSPEELDTVEIDPEAGKASVDKKTDKVGMDKIDPDNTNTAGTDKKADIAAAVDSKKAESEKSGVSKNVNSKNSKKPDKDEPEDVGDSSSLTEETLKDKTGKKTGTTKTNKNKSGKNRKGPKDPGTGGSDKKKPKTFNPFE